MRDGGGKQAVLSRDVQLHGWPRGILQAVVEGDGERVPGDHLMEIDVRAV